jgi:predicted nucleic acid-binding protein
VGLIAVWDTSDQWHAPAAKAFGELLHNRMPLYTSSQILLECGNAAARRPYRGRVNALRRQLMEANLLLEPSVQESEAEWVYRLNLMQFRQLLNQPV